jgi:hypothetical protein
MALKFSLLWGSQMRRLFKMKLGLSFRMTSTYCVLLSSWSLCVKPLERLEGFTPNVYRYSSTEFTNCVVARLLTSSFLLFSIVVGINFLSRSAKLKNALNVSSFVSRKKNRFKSASEQNNFQCKVLNFGSKWLANSWMLLCTKSVKRKQNNIVKIHVSCYDKRLIGAIDAYSKAVYRQGNNGRKSHYWTT